MQQVPAQLASTSFPFIGLARADWDPRARGLSSA